MVAKAFVCVAVLVATIASTTAASAAVHVGGQRVMGHRVRVVRWRPGAGVRALVGYSRHPRTVTGWADARHRGPIVAAINGGTWSWGTMRPVGTLWAHGRMVTRVQRRPAVGFLASGDVVFGARAARAAGSGNIISGAAYLVRAGVPAQSRSDAPWAGPVQWSCGPKGTDGHEGCWRSNVVRFGDGSVGLVEVAYASMRRAALVLRRLGVTDALTLDSGGSANLWTRAGGRGTCADPRALGHCFGISHAAGSSHDRAIPDAIVISTRNR